MNLPTLTDKAIDTRDSCGLPLVCAGFGLLVIPSPARATRNERTTLNTLHHLSRTRGSSCTIRTHKHKARETQARFSTYPRPYGSYQAGGA
jgi:hypothetical protein